MLRTVSLTGRRFRPLHAPGADVVGNQREAAARFRRRAPPRRAADRQHAGLHVHQGDRSTILSILRPDGFQLAIVVRLPRVSRARR